MLLFREISIKDKELFKNIEYISSDYVFSYIYMYSELYKLKIYHDDRTIIIHSGAQKPSFYMPLGDTEYGIKLILKYCQRQKIKPHFTKIPVSHIEIFKAMNFKIKEDRNSFDYIYSNLALSTYEGPKFQKQRNNVANYLKTNTPIYSCDIVNNIEKCKEFTLKYYAGTDVVQPTLKILDCIEEFNLKGGIVWNGSDINAYNIYEIISDNMAISHVELTNNSHRGVHAYMINEMSKNMDVEFINKEDDMGLPGLRRFKERYNPYALLVKYSAYPNFHL
ncbi:DUF2156 domain-containing protein [Caloramator sp. E03]|uniref:phosphatidylglycerol lysyltransferase domain-containing protein n=1 Tax=Caloramator sp. E03 TaxID=2576307 RepID=UPI0011102846|nr:phosphatidylglycerol lysyltransferase domain-containing protein [Caloramator sp. E03]QCX34225.1 DUF2156 domain-containing protein [Caloramator sp. E03]